MAAPYHHGQKPSAFRHYLVAEEVVVIDIVVAVVDTSLIVVLTVAKNPLPVEGISVLTPLFLQTFYLFKTLKDTYTKKGGDRCRTKHTGGGGFSGNRRYG